MDKKMTREEGAKRESALREYLCERINHRDELEHIEYKNDESIKEDCAYYGFFEDKYLVLTKEEMYDLAKENIWNNIVDYDDLILDDVLFLTGLNAYNIELIKNHMRTLLDDSKFGLYEALLRLIARDLHLIFDIIMENEKQRNVWDAIEGIEYGEKHGNYYVLKYECGAL